MGKIIILDENTSNKIAAGEVIERPASVIKELVENAIDAKASIISVEIKNGGISYIKVTDNGSGIEEDDVEIAFERHGTSKIKNADDLESISSLGFRGEALASIAAVSSVELTTRTVNNKHGSYIKIQGGNVKDVKQTGCPVGTTFLIKDLFFNTPARFKFLKKDATEAGYISDIIGRMAIGNPGISFKFISSNTTIIHTPGNNDLLSTIFSIYGKETAKDVLEVNFQSESLIIRGYAGKPEIARSSRNYQSIYINGRYVKSKLITSALDEAYKTFLMKNKYAFIVLNLDINPMVVDVNVHPTKMEVRFSDEQEIFRSVYHAVSNALLYKQDFREISVEIKEKDVFKFKEDVIEKKEYKQDNFVLKSSYVKEEQLKEEKKEFLNDKNIFPLKKENSIEQVIKKEDVREADIKDQSGLEIKKQVLLNEAIKKESSLIVETDNTANANLIIEKVASKSIEPDGWKNILINARIIGQAFSTYIVLQYENELILIDQHAAHERIKYEYLKTKFENNESFSQMIIAPVVVELTNFEIKYIENDKEIFNKIGFIYEYFGNNSIIIRSVPDVFEMNSVKDSFLEVLDSIMNSNTKDFKKVTDEALYTLACKAAVKANMWLNELEIKSLIEELLKIENPFTCPHGRPTVLKLTKHELEKLFKRII